MAAEPKAGFAKLQGEDFEYYMQSYSILLGRNSKKSTVDVDLASLGGGMNISRVHARVFYDFTRRRFALEVLGKNGCLVEGVLHLPSNQPVKLDSQDLLQIGDKKFYFLLPVKSILNNSGGISRHVQRQGLLAAPPVGKRKGRGRTDYNDEDEDEDEDDDEDDDEEEMDDDEGMTVGAGKKVRRVSVEGKAGPSGQYEKKSDSRSRADREADNHQLMQLEEKDVVSSVANVLSDLCGPGEWMPMEKLHSELLRQYGSQWHHSKVRRYLSSDEWPAGETKGRPWFGLLALLRKYPEHFVINIRSRGKVTSEFVSLVSLIQ